MQISFATQQPIGREGQLWGSDHKSRPYLLPQRAQTTTFLLEDSGPDADETWSITAIDSDNGQRFTLSWKSGASVDDTLNALLAAASIGKFRDLFTTTVDTGTDTATMVAKNKGKAYTFETGVSAGGGTITPTITVTAIDYDAAGLPFGRAVVRGSGEGEMAEIGATSLPSDIVGVLFLTDGNAFHSFDSDSIAAEDTCQRGSYQRVLESGRFLALVEEAVTPASRVYVRRALTSSAGRLGGFRGSPAGSAQVTTVVPVADQVQWAFTLTLRNQSTGEIRTFLAQYQASDGTTAVADAIDGLYDSLVQQLGSATASANGMGVTITESDTELTITTLAGVEIVHAANAFWSLDTEAATSVVTVGASDVDAIDCSHLFEFESIAGTNELAIVKLKGLA